MLASLLLLCLSAADFPGTWQLKSKDADGKTIQSVITFRDDGGQLKAVIRSGGKVIEANRIQRDGDKVIFDIRWEDDLIAVELNAEDSTHIKGQWRAGDDAGPIEGTRDSLAGLWKLTATRPNGSTMRIDLDIKQEGDKWVPVLRSPEGLQLPLDKIVINASQVAFDILAPHGTFKVQLNLEGATLKGTWATADQVSGPLEGVR